MLDFKFVPSDSIKKNVRNDPDFAEYVEELKSQFRVRYNFSTLEDDIFEPISLDYEDEEDLGDPLIFSKKSGSLSVRIYFEDEF